MTTPTAGVPVQERCPSCAAAPAVVQLAEGLTVCAGCANLLRAAAGRRQRGGPAPARRDPAA